MIGGVEGLALDKPSPVNQTLDLPLRACCTFLQVPRLLSGDDLRGLSRGREPGQRQPGDPAEFDDHAAIGKIVSVHLRAQFTYNLALLVRRYGTFRQKRR